MESKDRLNTFSSNFTFSLPCPKAPRIRPMECESEIFPWVMMPPADDSLSFDGDETETSDRDD